MDAIHEAKMQMIEAGGRTAESFGISGLLGRVYMFLYLAEEPRCLDEIVAGLGVSKASASIACRQLQSLAAVKPVWRMGDRRGFYQAETNLRTLLRQGVLAGVNKKLDSAREQIRQCRTHLENHADGDPKAEPILQRLKEAEKFRSKIHALLNNPLLQRFL